MRWFVCTVLSLFLLPSLVAIEIELVNNTSVEFFYSFGSKRTKVDSGKVPSFQKNIVTLSSSGCFSNCSKEKLSISHQGLLCHYQVKKKLFGGLKIKLDRNNHQSCLNWSVYTNEDHSYCGSKNCVVVNPDPNWARETFQLQNQMARFSPLSDVQVLSTHNSAVSHHYIKNTLDAFFALNQSLSITEQLNLGLRFIELDIVYSNGDVRICHYHTKHSPSLLCDGNVLFSTVLQEIKDWIDLNPSEFLQVYLDINCPMSVPQVKTVELDIVSHFGLRVYTLLDAYHYDSTNDYGPEYNKPIILKELTIDSLVKKFRQIVFYAKKGTFDDSCVVFTSTSDEKDSSYLKEIPDDHGISNFPNNNSCKDACAPFEDAKHASFWRINEDRSLASKIAGSGDYLNLANIKRLLPCPINTFSLDFLVDESIGYTLDPRLSAQIWSWQLGFPLAVDNKTTFPYAVIDQQRGFFVNNVDLMVQGTYSVLCHDKRQNPSWFVVGLDQMVTLDSVQATMQGVCQRWGGDFAVPTNSSQKFQVDKVVKAQEYSYVLVNYFYINKKGWIANNVLLRGK